MPHRFAFLLAVLLSVPLVTGPAAHQKALADSYALKGYGSTAGDRHSVSALDYTWFDAQRGRSVPARIYYPADAAENQNQNQNQKFPVVVFSTGLGRSRDDCAYLGRHWASCGYVSVHLQHKGSDEEARQGLRPRKELQRAFYSPQNIRNRPIDAIFAIDQLHQMQRAGAVPGNRLDLTRIGVAGHDFGAQTALGLAGQVLPGRIAFVESRVKAVLAISAPVPLGQVPLDLAYDGVGLPCLHITGTADNSIVATTTAPQRRLPFDYTSGTDQYLVTFFGADHLTYSGHARPANAAHDALFQRLIAECSAAFWDAYLKDDAEAKDWLAGDGIGGHLRSTARVEKKLAPVDSIPFRED